MNDNTLAGLVFNNSGATSNGAAAGAANVNPTVNSYTPGVGNNGTGVLTIGASGIVSNSSNVADDLEHRGPDRHGRLAQHDSP